MDKKVYKAVSERSEGHCEVCGIYQGDRLELHHILRRKVKEIPLNCIMLCLECHRGTNGVHGMNGRELDLRLKKELQEKYFNKGYEEEKVRRLMGGKIY